MSIIIPSINCPPKATGCVYDRIAAAKKMFASLPAEASAQAGRVHLDIADGVFTFHKTWDEPERWPHPHAPGVEVHLMVEDAQEHVSRWIGVPGADRFILHAETAGPAAFRAIAERLRRRGKSVMLAISPETSVHAFEPYLEDVLQFQFLAVHPGLSGQRFLPRTIEKITWLRRRVPGAIIEVDGGITPEVAALAHRAGADMLVSGSYIFDSPDPARAYKELTGAL